MIVTFLCIGFMPIFVLLLFEIYLSKNRATVNGKIFFFEKQLATGDEHTYLKNGLLFL